MHRTSLRSGEVPGRTKRRACRAARGATRALRKLLAQTVGALQILEVGTLGGYSTIRLARALLPPDGALVSLEIDPDHATVARATSPARARTASPTELQPT